jgi:hypothetical protein
MAYKSKYYDPVKAHEYYMKHRKLKGRKKKTSIADLSEAGKIAAKEVKEQLQAELKAALKKVKRGNTAERKRLRELYQQKYEAELDEIRKDPTMLKALKQKKEKQPKAAKSSGGSRSSRSSSRSSSKSSGTSKTSQAATTTLASDTATKVVETPKTESEKILDTVNQIKDKLDVMTDEQKAQAKILIESLIEQYKKKLLAEKGLSNGENG